jgi:uncharacterized protein (DUF362 family)/NAD-dependent dihydropyrimidine dehydrogenase PreA subunit
MKSKVALVRCNSYEINEVRQAVSRGMELLGGAGKFVKPGEKIVLKVNLLAADPPEKCVTTHPSVFKAVAEIFRNEGAIISYGDSPGYGAPHSTARKAGLTEAAEELNIEFADFKEGQEIFFEEGIQNKKFFIANGILNSDGVISLPKMKAHGFMRFTGSIKNQFGCVVGMRKGEFHIKLADPADFAKMIVDLNNFIRPRLYIMDGITAMEGNGPRGGNPKQMNVLLFSTDPVALDATACRLINLDPAYVPTTLYGSKTGSGTFSEEETEILGDDPKSFFKPDFIINRTPVVSSNKSRVFQFLNNQLIPKPFIISGKCTKCGTCVMSCPVEGKAVNWLNGDHSRVPVYNYDKCIRCYCCQEMCPESAIILKETLIRKVVNMLKK